MAGAPATSYRITAVVDGLEKVEALKQTIKLLANQTSPAADAVNQLRQQALELGRASNASTKDIRTAVDALKGLKDVVSLASDEYKVLSGDIQSIGSRLDTATSSVTRHTQAHAALGRVVNANSRALNNYFNNAAVRQQEQLNQRIEQQMRAPTLALPAAGQSSFRGTVDASGFGGGARRGTGTKESPFEMGRDYASKQRYMGATRSDSEVAAAAGYLERDAAAAKNAAAATNQYQTELEQLFNSIRKYQGQQVANKNQQVAYSYKELSEEITRVTASSNGSLNSLRQQRQLWEQLYNSVEKTDPAYAKARANMQRLDKDINARSLGGQNRLQRFGETAGAVAASGVFGGPEGAIGAGIGAAFGPGGALAGGAIGAQVGMLRQQLGGTATYAAELDKQRIALKLILKDTNDYNAAIAFLSKTSSDYAIPQDRLIKGFTQLSASVIGAGGNISDAKTAFEGITAGIRGTGRSLDDLDGALLATAQVFSKGKVSAEELRGQIGERLPGAYNLFARAIGKTPQELDKALERGEVSLADFLQFSKTVFGEYGENAKIIAASPEAAGDRLQTSLKNLSENVGKLLRPIGAAFQSTFASIIDKINQAAISLANFLGMNKSNAQRIGELNNLIIVQKRGIAREQQLAFQGTKSKEASQYSINEFNKRIVQLQAEAKALKAVETAGKDQSKSRSSLADTVTTPSVGSKDDSAKKAKDAAKAAAELASQQQKYNEEVIKAQIELDNDRFRYAQELIRKQYEYEQELQRKTRDNWVKSQTGAARTAAGIISSYFGELEDLQGRVLSGKEVVAQARQQASSAAQLASVTGSTVQSSDSNVVSRLFSAASSKLGLFAGQTERCADAIRELFKAAGVAIGTTKKAWDGLASGPRLASSFFGSDVGQRINKKEDLRPGDLVGFERTYGKWGKGVQTHVGMYAGNGMMFDHSSKQGLVKRPLDTFAGKFMYGVRPYSLAGQVTPGATAAQNAQQRRAVKAEGKAGEGDLAVTAAQQQLKLLEDQVKKLTPEIAKAFELDITEQIRQQNSELEKSAQITQLRNRLQLEGARPEIIDGEVEKTRITQTATEYQAKLTEKITEATRQYGAQSVQVIALQAALTAYNNGITVTRQLIDAATSSSIRFNDESKRAEGLKQQYAQIGQALGNILTGAFDNLINKTRSWKDFMVDALKNIGSLLFKVGLNMLAGPQGSGGFLSFLGFGFANGGIMTGSGPMPLKRYSSGGIANSPQLAMFGEGRTPEAFVPLPDGRRIPVAMEGGGKGLRDAMGSSMGAQAAPVLNMSFQSTTIGGTEYVDRAQLEQAMAETRRAASRDGAKRGMSMTLDRLQQSPATRSRIGIGGR